MDRQTSGKGSADPIRWARAQDIFHAALNTPPEDREGYVQAACADDAGLQAEVLSLLASDGLAGDFIEQPAAALLAPAAESSFRPRLRQGTALGRYDILQFLGAGGISEVYRARDTRLGRTVAVKLIANRHDPQAGPRLLAEAQHASILNHPNICAVYEAEQGGGPPYIVLELVEGPTLHQVLKERRPSAGEITGWAIEIADALEHAHRRGVIHRDLKCANVALSTDGRIKILDFGLSRRFAEAPQPAQTPTDILHDTSVAGTLTHIAPEVLRGERLDERVDLWALGVMLYEMASGRLPFKRATALQTADAILEASPEALPTSVPADLRRVIARCLHKDPAVRFRTAAELRDALGACRSTRRAFGGFTRRWGLAAAILLALVALPVSRWLWGGRPEALVIAVVPLEGSAGDSTDTFFAAGVTEGLIAELGRVDGIRVLAPTPSLRARSGAASNRETARSAGANRLL
jgi:tRNA A-37 threonylcarbamoyl transferase component Bud32